MALSATELRAQIYKILDSVAETGKPVEIERKGKKLLIVSADDNDKLAHLVARSGVILGNPEDLVHCDWSGEIKLDLPRYPRGDLAFRGRIESISRKRKNHA